MEEINTERKTRTCSKCAIEKAIEEFHRNATATDGRTAHCKSCQKVMAKSYRERNKESIRAAKAKYREDNKEAIKARKAQYRTKHKEQIVAHPAAYYEANKEVIKKKHALYYESNKNAVRKQAAEYISDPENLKIKMLYAAKRRASDRGLPFTISVDDINIPDLCPALGIPLERGKGKCHDNSPSLDRIIPELGYVKGNVIVVSHLANTIKSNATVEQLRRVAAFYEPIAA